jgi:hypothetical protein
MSDKPTPNLPVSVEDQIKKELEQQSGQIGALPVNKISLGGKKFTLPDGQSSEGPLVCVVLDFAWFMVNYPGVYNAASPQKPNCFAVGRDQPGSGLLVPHTSVEKPQAKNCNDCEMNEWGSSPVGKGKACKNQRRLIIVPEKFDENSEPMTMYVSPAGLKNFDAYVTRLRNEHNILPAQAITEISFDPDQSYSLLKFKFVNKHDNLNVAWVLRDQAQDILFRETETEPTAKK